jgi:hypothetical protein
MTRVVGCFELLEHVLAGQHQTLPAALAGNLGGRQRWHRGAASGDGFSLLLLDRLALPSSRHRKIIAANRGSENHGAERKLRELLSGNPRWVSWYFPL